MSAANPAGYSGTTLAKKLGIKPGHSILLLNAPSGFVSSLDPIPEGASFHAQQPTSRHYAVILAFYNESGELQARLASLRALIFPEGSLWICWPKKASKVPTDLTEDVVRRLALAEGLVDVKVCAVDAVWSGLKLVVPVSERG